MPERRLHETVHLGEHRGREDVVENRRMVGDDDRSPEGAHLCEGLALNRHDGAKKSKLLAIIARALRRRATGSPTVSLR